MHRLSRLKGFHILATDGEIGHVDDFLIDADTCQIRYLVVDTSNWIGGQWVAISIRSVIGVEWTEKLIRVGLTRQLVKESPALDETNVPPNELTPFTII